MVINRMETVIKGNEPAHGLHRKSIHGKFRAASRFRADVNQVYPASN